MHEQDIVPAGISLDYSQDVYVEEPARERTSAALAAVAELDQIAEKMQNNTATPAEQARFNRHVAAMVAEGYN